MCNSVGWGKHRPLRFDVSASVINKAKQISPEKKTYLNFYRENVLLISSLLTKPRQFWSCPGLSFPFSFTNHPQCAVERCPGRSLCCGSHPEPAVSRPPRRLLFICHRNLGITLIHWPRGFTSFLTRIIILGKGRNWGVTRVRSGTWCICSRDFLEPRKSAPPISA